MRLIIEPDYSALSSWAANYVAKVSDEISFDAFNKILKNESLSMEMRGLINQLVNKLYNINYIHTGLMMAS